MLVDLRGFHTSLVDDPIRRMVYFGNQNDVDKIIEDGRTVAEHGQVPGVDLQALSMEANEVNQRWEQRMGTLSRTALSPNDYLLIYLLKVFSDKTIVHKWKFYLIEMYDTLNINIIYPKMSVTFFIFYNFDIFTLFLTRHLDL